MSTISSSAIDTLAKELPELARNAAHSEIWGVDLSAPDTPPARLVVAKYLRANKGDHAAARSALEATLRWRKEYKPRSAASDETHDFKFEGLGYITKLSGGDVVTWNIYGAAAKDPKAVFEPVDQFLRWRVGLMERSVAALQLEQYTGDGTEDTKQGIQVHDYDNVSFFRSASSSRIPSVFEF